MAISAGKCFVDFGSFLCVRVLIMSDYALVRLCDVAIVVVRVVRDECVLFVLNRTSMCVTEQLRPLFCNADIDFGISFCSFGIHLHPFARLLFVVFDFCRVLVVVCVFVVGFIFLWG
jgi:hypothetical protein